MAVEWKKLAFTADIVAERSAAVTITNKRNQKRVDSQASTATITPEISTYDVFVRTAQAEALDIANHSTSSPANREAILIQIKDNATPAAITYGTNYIDGSITKPTTTIASKWLTLLFVWFSGDEKFHLEHVGNEV